MSGFPYVSFVPASACVDLGLQVRHARGNGIGFLARTGLYKEIEFGVSYMSLGCGGFSLLACHIGAILRTRPMVPHQQWSSKQWG